MRSRKPWLPALLWAALPGCGEAAERLGRTLQERVQESVEHAAAPEPAPPAEAQLSRKLDLFLDCTSASRQRMLDAWADYTTSIDPAAGTPRGAAPDIRAISESDLAPCVTALREAPRHAPPLPELELAQAEYTAAARELAELSRELGTYYRQRGYEHDAWARGKELAPRVKASFERWKVADDELGARIDATRDEADQRTVDLIARRSGKNIEYLSRNYLLEARTFARCMARKPPVLEECEAAFVELDRANTDFRSFYDGHRDACDKVFWMTSFQSSVTDYHDEAASTVRALRAGNLDRDRLARVSTAYEDLVRDSHNLRFEPMPN